MQWLTLLFFCFFSLRPVSLELADDDLGERVVVSKVVYSEWTSEFRYGWCLPSKRFASKLQLDMSGDWRPHFSSPCRTWRHQHSSAWLPESSWIMVLGRFCIEMSLDAGRWTVTSCKIKLRVLIGQVGMWRRSMTSLWARFGYALIQYCNFTSKQLKISEIWWIFSPGPSRLLWFVSDWRRVQLCRSRSFYAEIASTFGKHRKSILLTSIDYWHTRVKDPVLDDHLSGPGMIVELAPQKWHEISWNDIGTCKMLRASKAFHLVMFPNDRPCCDVNSAWLRKVCVGGYVLRTTTLRQCCSCGTHRWRWPRSAMGRRDEVTIAEGQLMGKGVATFCQRLVDTSAKRSWQHKHSHSKFMTKKAETVPRKSAEILQEAKDLNLPPNAMDDLIDRLGGLKKAKSLVLQVLDRTLPKRRLWSCPHLLRTSWCLCDSLINRFHIAM